MSGEQLRLALEGTAAPEQAAALVRSLEDGGVGAVLQRGRTAQHLALVHRELSAEPGNPGCGASRRRPGASGGLVVVREAVVAGDGG
ncbi:hypothetical protein AB0K15_46405 [Amycolatopsis sp. NPDC049253]|uniref:hypothetical protein n=1 Tax=Amycolatopsis sp. NPDC049253 TaxID=3155274 RepID=UPI003412589D